MTERDTAESRGWVAEVIVVPKPGVNDPQGEAIRGGLRSLGYAGLGEVRSGRFFHLTLSARDKDSATEAAIEMCDRLLANPVIETYTVALRPAADPESDGAPPE